MGLFPQKSRRGFARARHSSGFIYGSRVLVAVVVALVATLSYGAWGDTSALAQEGGSVDPAAADSTVVLVLPYQGALLDPATGSARPDGDYSMTFRLYTAQTGGSAIWTETKNVVVNDGIFLTYLGNTTALNLNHFNGQNLWLGVTVGSDDEATPRMRLGFVGHAFWAENARNATNATSAVNATNAENAANAAALGGQAPAAFAPASHNHDGRYYTKAEADDRYLVKSSIYAFSDNSSNDPVLRVENLGTHDGIFAVTASTIAGRAGVQGRAGAVGPIINSVAGVFGSSASYRGVIGSSTDSDGMLGFSSNNNGIYGQSINGVGVRAFSQFGNALYTHGSAVIDGNLQVTGSFSKSSGTFMIDHPLDPANKYLYHSFVESPDMMNIYNGNVTLDANGEAWVTLPTYFEALNRDFRYQLTPIGGAAPNLYIAQGVTGNQFRIAGGVAGLTVSWQVTGVRQDPYAEMNRVQVEVEKPADERGTYLFPEGYGQPRERSVEILEIPVLPAPGVERTE